MLNLRLLWRPCCRSQENHWYKGMSRMDLPLDLGGIDKLNAFICDCSGDPVVEVKKITDMKMLVFVKSLGQDHARVTLRVPFSQGYIFDEWEFLLGFGQIVKGT
jgi:hypothetical protein